MWLHSMCIRQNQYEVAYGWVQESSKVGEENAGLRQQLADIQASLSQLTQTNQATLQDAQVPARPANLQASSSAFVETLCIFCSL